MTSFIKQTLKGIFLRMFSDVQEWEKTLEEKSEALRAKEVYMEIYESELDERDKKTPEVKLSFAYEEVSPHLLYKNMDAAEETLKFLKNMTISAYDQRGDIKVIDFAKQFLASYINEREKYREAHGIQEE